MCLDTFHGLVCVLSLAVMCVCMCICAGVFLFFGAMKMFYSWHACMLKHTHMHIITYTNDILMHAIHIQYVHAYIQDL
jgi:hypothetical protein